MSEPGIGGTVSSPPGDRSELAVVFLRLLAVDTAEDVVVLLLEPAGAFEVGIRAADDAAPDITARKDSLVLADRGDAGKAQRRDGVGQLAGRSDERRRRTSSSST